MKKLFLALPLLLIPIFISLFFVNAGMNSWTQDLTGAPVFNACLVIHPTNPQIMYAGTNGSGVYLTIDGGTTWIPSNTGLNLSINAIAIAHSNPNILYAGTATAGMYKTTDAGATWTAINTGITENTSNVEAIVIKPTDPNTVVMCVFNGTTDATNGFYKTTNGGTSWAASTSGLPTMHNFLSMINNPVTPNTIYTGSSFFTSPQTGPCYIYKSYDFGSTWVNSSNGLGTATTSTDVIRALSYSTVDTNHLLAGLFFNTSNGGPWITTNAGGLWTQMAGGIPISTTPGPLIRSAQMKPGTNQIMYFGGDFATNSVPPGGVWRSINGGQNWVDFNSGVMTQNNVVRALAYRSTDNTVFAGVSLNGTGVYEYTTSPPELINHNGQDIPKDFALHQNFPNPFNPTTMITFDLPRSQDVSIEVYDVNGKLVKTIMREFKPAGSYQINFNASSLTSGVYFYKLTTTSFVDTKKMILVK
ncbi:MAG: T9SS type A sorting domain-containing protein [Ignavibacteria bacterium]